MRKFVKKSLAIGALVAAIPAAAQSPEPKEAATKSVELDELAGMLAGLFQTEPLDAEQQARLPAAQAVVGAMMPDGFYGKMMGDMIEKMMRPMMAMFTQPEFILGTRLDLEESAIAALGEAEQVELAEMLDPAYDTRVDAIINVMTDKMGGMFAAMEGPMRAGLAKAYAVRFDDAQLADIDAFFHTPTGNLYARESMALFADPQVMQAIMQAMPKMMNNLGDIEGAMTEAMASLPAERAYEDLSSAQRARLAEILKVSPAALAKIVKPPKAKDGGATEEGM